uniref:Uncharacterized protein n=1 Tax=Oryza punctata TaxID=4537 RepID=A0A0E0LTN6_ORYPU
MVVGFRRTISFPAPKVAATTVKGEAYRVRSASLVSGASASSVAGAAEQVGRVLVSLSELLHHP